MPSEKQPPKERIKVTDKRIFTADGELREEFRDEIKPADPVTAPSRPSPEPQPEQQPSESPAPATATAPAADAAPAEPHSAAAPEESREPQRRRNPADPPPDTPFIRFVESLIMQAYMSLGMMRNPYQPQQTVDAAAARQMIDILIMLQQKTSGNLTPDEEEFLTTHLGELKLAFVQRTKTL